MYHSQFCAKLTRIQNSKCIKVMALEEWHVADEEDHGLAFSHGHTKITVYRATVDEKDQKTRRENLLQLEI